MTGCTIKAGPWRFQQPRKNLKMKPLSHISIPCLILRARFGHSDYGPTAVTHQVVETQTKTSTKIDASSCNMMKLTISNIHVSDFGYWTLISNPMPNKLKKREVGNRLRPDLFWTVPRTEAQSYVFYTYSSIRIYRQMIYCKPLER